MEENRELLTMAQALEATASDKWTIENSTDEEFAGTLGGQIAATEKQIKDFFKPMKDAANAAHKAIVDKEKQYLGPLAAGKAMIKAKMNKYRQAQEAKRLAMEAELKEKTGSEVDIPRPAAPTNTQYRALWKWEIVDSAKIPKEYWILDEVKIGREVRTKKGETNIPGIEVKDVGTVAFKG